VVRSCQSMTVESFSVPTTRARRYRPERSMSVPTWRAKTKPEHAAETSKAGMSRRRPNLACSKQAVEGKGTSGVIVATISRSMSSGLSPAFCIACAAALAPMSEGFSSGPAMRRSEIPERVLIHSSLVSTSLERSSLVNFRSGAWTPTERMKTDSAAVLIKGCEKTPAGAGREH